MQKSPSEALSPQKGPEERDRVYEEKSRGGELPPVGCAVAHNPYMYRAIATGHANHKLRARRAHNLIQMKGTVRINVKLMQGRRRPKEEVEGRDGGQLKKRRRSRAAREVVRTTASETKNDAMSRNTPPGPKGKKPVQRTHNSTLFHA